MSDGDDGAMAAQIPAYEGGRGTDLPMGWCRWVDPSNNQYYYHNESTGETTWDDPTRWKVGLWLDRVRGVAGPAAALPAYEPRSIEAAFAEWCASRNGARSFDEDDGGDDDDEDELSFAPAEEGYEVVAGRECAVTLHVYDVKFRGAQLLNGVLNKSSGAFHTAVEVHGLEWSFGATLGGDEEACGVFACAPMSARPHVYRESVPLGATSRSPVDVFNVLLRVAPFWRGCTYDVFRKNCNSFCIVLAGELGADPPPPWTHRLGDGAAALDDRARRLVAALRGEAKPEPSGRAVIVWDDHGEWHREHYASAAAAREVWDDLSLAHASVLFVKTEDGAGVGGLTGDAREEDDPAWTWTPVRTYGLPHATARIKDRFFKSRALRRPDADTVTHRPANRLLRPRRRSIDTDPPHPPGGVAF